MGCALVMAALIGYLVRLSPPVSPEQIRGAIAEQERYRSASGGLPSPVSSPSSDPGGVPVNPALPALAAQPAFKEVLASPEFSLLVRSSDFASLVRNPEFVKLLVERCRLDAPPAGARAQEDFDSVLSARARAELAAVSTAASEILESERGLSAQPGLSRAAGELARSATALRHASDPAVLSRQARRVSWSARRVSKAAAAERGVPAAAVLSSTATTLARRASILSATSGLSALSGNPAFRALAANPGFRAMVTSSDFRLLARGRRSQAGARRSDFQKLAVTAELK